MKKLFAVLVCVCMLAMGVCGFAEEKDFLSEVQGTFVELFPELSKEEYHQKWVDAVEPLVGEENTEATIEYLLSACTAEIYGAEAIEKYAADPESMRFDCYYIGGVKKMTIEGNRITGVDADGNEVFSHTYTAMDVENENGFIFYKSDDEQSGQFTYFAFSPDTMDTTWHLEFRYAEDEADLQDWFTGNYAYWNVGAIAEDYTDEVITSTINLFATENVGGTD